MEGFGLLVGHLLGDYWPLQNDWIAANKTNKGWIGNYSCTLHCILYTLSIWLFSYKWMPWWGLLTCFLAHWPIDRFRIARKLMDWTGQKEFAKGVFSPWSIIVVDNTLHLLTLYIIAIIAGV